VLPVVELLPVHKLLRRAGGALGSRLVGRCSAVGERAGSRRHGGSSEFPSTGEAAGWCGRAARSDGPWAYAAAAAAPRAESAERCAPPGAAQQPGAPAGSMAMAPAARARTHLDLRPADRLPELLALQQLEEEEALGEPAGEVRCTGQSSCLPRALLGRQALLRPPQRSRQGPCARAFPLRQAQQQPGRAGLWGGPLTAEPWHTEAASSTAGT
jgi:hypothetical protein